MSINYAVALVNYQNYTQRRVPNLERTIYDIHEQGMGVELWRTFGDEPDLYTTQGVERLKPLLEPVEHISTHGTNSNSMEDHRFQIDFTAHLGGTIIVIHDDAFLKVDRLIEEATQLARGSHTRLTIQLERMPDHYDFNLLREMVQYAGEKDVRVAYENGVVVPPYDRISVPLQEVSGLGICLDTGHLNRPWLPEGADPMPEFLKRFKHDIIHLHLHDSFRETEADDHLIPGQGGTTTENWQLLVNTLNEVDFNGMGVLEMAVRMPIFAANVSRDFLGDYL